MHPFYHEQLFRHSQNHKAMRPIIALMTDFGQDDIYVGVMKGVILGICREAELVDITHQIEPQHIRQAAFALMNAYRYFPIGTIFVVVVDPGVGSKRRPIAVQGGSYTFIAPDNGVLSYALSTLESHQAIEIANQALMLTNVSYSFHGRDVFAPAAAHLANGTSFPNLGTALDTTVQLPPPDLVVSQNAATGEVVDIDRFGNLITNIGLLHWQSSEKLVLIPAFGHSKTAIPIQAKHTVTTIQKHSIRCIHTTYSEALRGDFIAIVGSSGFLEIAVNQGSAATRLGAAIGNRVVLGLGAQDAAVHH